MKNPLFQNTNLETDRLIIRPFRPTDADQLHAVVSQPEVVRFLPEEVMTLEEVKNIINWFLTCYEKNTPENIIKWTLGIILKETSCVIGWTGLGPLDFSPRETELFCGLSQAYWGKGIAAEACRVVLDYAFSDIGLNRIVAVVNPVNHQSVRLIEKLGMTREKQVQGLSDEFRHYEGHDYYSISESVI